MIDKQRPSNISWKIFWMRFVASFSAKGKQHFFQKFAIGI